MEPHMRMGRQLLMVAGGLLLLGCPENNVALPGEASSSSGNMTLDPDGGGMVGTDGGGVVDGGNSGSSSGGSSAATSSGAASSGGASSVMAGSSGAPVSSSAATSSGGVGSSAMMGSSGGATSSNGSSSNGTGTSSPPSSGVGSSMGTGSSASLPGSSSSVPGSSSTGAPDAGMGMDAGTPDAGMPPNVCQGQPTGIACPGSMDPNNAERCLNNVCVGTYVSPAGDSNNPGTRAAPKRFIVEGLAVAAALSGQDTVVVGKLAGAAAVFNEDVRVGAETNLSGGWLHDGAAGWTRDVMQHETRITPTTAEGLIVQTGATRTNVTISGFHVVGLATTNADTAAITLRTNASPSLLDLTVTGGVSQANSVGLRVVNQDNPVLRRVTITGGTGNASAAVRVSQGRAEIFNSTLTGGSAVAGSVALQCEGGCPGLRVEDSVLSGGQALDAAAVGLGGDISGVVVRNCNLTGGPSGSDATAPAYPGRRAGLAVDNCPTLTLNRQVVTVEGSTVRGVTLPGAVGVAMGIYVAGNCGLNLSGSPYVTGAESGAGPVDTVVDQAFGVLCSGAQSDCLLEANTLITGTRNVTGMQAGASARILAAGVALEGDGTVRGRATQDATRVIQHIVGGVAPSAVGLSHAPGLVGASVGTLVFEFNQVEGGACTGVDPERGVAGMVVATPARIINNVILGGSCDNRSTGLLLHPSINSSLGQQPLVLNNHIDAVGFPGLTSTSAGVTVAPLAGLNVPLPVSVGNLVNNTILGGVSALSFCVAEASPNVDVALLRNNNLFGGVAPFLDEAMTVVLTINDVNNLPGATSNLREDPLVDQTFHLGPTSPNRGAGQRNGGGVSAPDVDFDGERRPIPTNDDPDIGPDERN